MRNNNPWDMINRIVGFPLNICSLKYEHNHRDCEDWMHFNFCDKNGYTYIPFNNPSRHIFLHGQPYVSKEELEINLNRAFFYVENIPPFGDINYHPG